MEHSPIEKFGRSNRLKKAGTWLAALSMATGLGVETAPAMAANFDSSTPNAETKAKNPLFEHTNHRIQVLTTAMRQMVSDHNPFIFSEPTRIGNKNGSLISISRTTISPEGAPVYKIFGMKIIDGQKQPSSIISTESSSSPYMEPSCKTQPSPKCVQIDIASDNSLALNNWLIDDQRGMVPDPEHSYKLDNDTSVNAVNYPKIIAAYNGFTNGGKRLVDSINTRIS